MSRKICICATQVPFASGGAEVLVDSLRQELEERGHACEVVRLPFSWSSRPQVLKSALAWRMIDLKTFAGDEIDLVISTRFPSYLIRHPNKVVWLIHQFRQVYDLQGTAWSDYGDHGVDRRTAEMVRAMDGRALAEARGLFTISRNTAARLKEFNGLDGEALYPPPKLGDRYRDDGCGDYVFAVGRLDKMKRFDQLVQAMRHAETGRAVIAGSGPERQVLEEQIERLGLGDRVELAGWVDDDRLLELLAGCRAVYYAPFDEDYGYVTVEAFKSGKPVITTADAGGVLEFVQDGVNGAVAPTGSPRKLGQRIGALCRDEAAARRLGAAGRERVAEIDWDRVVDRLTETLPR